MKKGEERVEVDGENTILEKEREPEKLLFQTSSIKEMETEREREKENESGTTGRRRRIRKQ